MFFRWFFDSWCVYVCMERVSVSDVVESQDGSFSVYDDSVVVLREVLDGFGGSVGGIDNRGVVGVEFEADELGVDVGRLKAMVDTDVVGLLELVSFLLEDGDSVGLELVLTDECIELVSFDLEYISGRWVLGIGCRVSVEE